MTNLSSSQIGLIIALSVFAFCIIAFFAIFFSVRIRNKKYERFVTGYSERIHELVSINKKYVFYDFKDSYTLFHQYDNKTTWRKVEPVAYLTKCLRDNYDKWAMLKKSVEHNRIYYTKYVKEISGINSHITSRVCINFKMNYTKCLKVEKKLFGKMQLKPSINALVVVHLRYESPKKRVTEDKKQVFKYEEFVRTLDSVSSFRMDRETYERFVAAERSILTDSMRYDVLRRDGFKCVLCGMSSSDGAILHVDHIIPVSKGGKTVMSNLRTLCERCNLGKSNKIE